jgi:phosphatidylglycerol:prolipoprotein diacylglycerol transferase
MNQGTAHAQTAAFWQWWQHIPQHLDPVLLRIGPFSVQYYGLMYLVAFLLTYLLVCYRRRRDEGPTLAIEQIQALTTYMIVGVLVGGRLGYVLFYNLAYYLHHPLEIILPFSFSGGVRFTGIAGMSFHGGALGVLLAAFLFARKSRTRYLDITDLYAPAIPLGYTFGRVGNFINGELYGRVTEKPWGMIFPLAPDDRLRHPSQLYEAFSEGIFLFVLLWSLRKRLTGRGALTGLYLMGYGAVRFVIEFVRQPDSHLGFVAWRFSMGQVLCLIMMLVGLMVVVVGGRDAGTGSAQKV